MRELIRGFLQDATQEEVPGKLLLDRVRESIKEYANKIAVEELKSIAKEIYIRKELRGPIANRIKELEKR